ncbi:MAG: polyprenol monophosphomannose synthase [Acidimicrobiales bacterium]
MAVLVIVPTYNEIDNIAMVVGRIKDALPQASVLVVDDASPDGTAGAVRVLKDHHPDVHLLERPGKAGLGSAYRVGFSWGLEHGYDVMVEIDADGSHDPADLPQLVEAIRSGHELAIGSRYVAGGSIPNWKLHRHLLSKGGNRYASVVLGLGVADSTAGFRAYAGSLLARLELGSVRAEGYGFQIEMTYRARRVGASITEVPIRFVDRQLGESKMSSKIVVEALLLVTWWGAGRLLSGAFRGGARRRAPRK